MKVSGTAVGLLLTIAALASMSAPVSVWAQDAARVAAGEDAWNKAGCFQCHGTSGEGGEGGEFPAGPSLRATKLDRATLAETISCGRPGTPMPAWLDGAYARSTCYGLPKRPADVVLTPVLSADEIAALLDYLMAEVVGR
jgi:mono/diheme cytochrome c family protein